MSRIGLLVLCSLLGSAAEKPVVSVEDLLNEKLMRRIQDIDERLTGVLGVAVVDLSANRTLTWHGDTLFPQASSIKIPIMIELFQAAREGRLKLTDTVTLKTGDAVGGSGHLRILLLSRPVTLSVSELLTAMIETSDNTATNRLIELLGMDRVNARLEAMGLSKSRLQRIMLDSDAAKHDRENVSTPLEMARLAELIYRGKAVDADASKQMIETMKLVEADFRAAIPAAVPVASKPGSVPGVHCETGIVFLQNRPFVLSVMATYLEHGVNPIPDVARLVFAHFSKLAASNRYGNRVY